MLLTVLIGTLLGVFPQQWDWRNVNGSNWLNPVHNGAPRDQLPVPPASWGGEYAALAVVPLQRAPLYMLTVIPTCVQPNGRPDSCVANKDTTRATVTLAGRSPPWT